MRRNELPEHEAGRAQAPERMADGRRVRVARLGDRLLVRGVRAGLLRQEEDEHTEIEVREREPGNVTDTEKQEGEAFVICACRREGVERAGLVEGRSGGL